MLSIKKLFTKILTNLKTLNDDVGDLTTDVEKLNGVKIPRNADLNDYTTVGQYYASSNETASSLSNKPSNLSVPFTLFVLNKGGLKNQLIYGNDVSIWFRTQYSGGWRDWWTYVPKRSVSVQTWSDITPTVKNQYYTLKTITIPANRRYLIVAQNGNSVVDAALCMCGFERASGSGAVALQWAEGLNNSGAGNRALGWLYIETGATEYKINIRTYSYALAVGGNDVVWNGVAVAIPV